MLVLRNVPLETYYDGVECVKIEKEKPQSLKLLDAASQLASIPTSIPPAWFIMENFTDAPTDKLKKVVHLLGLLVESEQKVKDLDFSNCRIIDSRSIRPLLRLIPYIEYVSFSNTKPSKRTMEEVGRWFPSEETAVTLKWISFDSCQLSDAHIIPILPHLVRIEEVWLSDNPNITMTTFESLFKVVKSMKEVRMKELRVDYELKDRVKKMFVQCPKIEII